jgi:Fe-S-cluster containining protein
MGKDFICSQGHAWQGFPPAPDVPLLCPMCGGAGRLIPSPPPDVPGSVPPWRTAAVDFMLGGQRVHAEFNLPTAPVRARQMLPVFQTLTDFVVQQGVQAAEANGTPVSCKKGCAACCRQVVLLSEQEARHLHDLVGRLPEPQRAAIEARFAQAGQRLHEAGLLEPLRRLAQLRRDEIAALSLRYFALFLDCPFLEAEACSIYADRPLLCREYVVTSPAANCSRPAEVAIRGVPLAAQMSTVIARLGDPARPGRWVPLVLALEWAAAHPDEPPPQPALELLREVFQQIA